MRTFLPRTILENAGYSVHMAIINTTDHSILTMTRGATGGHYVTKLDRVLTVYEMGAWQGLPPDAIPKIRGLGQGAW